MICGILEQLSKANLIIALYSYIEAKNSYLIKNKNINYSSIANQSSKLIKAASKMANVDYRAVVNKTSKRPNLRQKATQNLSRQDVGAYWMKLLEEKDAT